jgi:concanavalin A-like lectin/glucanase superfamily protein
MAVAGVGLALACGCGEKVLTVVGRCPDGGAFSPSVGCAPAGLLDDLVGYWKLDDATGSTMANDLTGRNHGTLVDLDPATAWVTGRAAGGLAVEGGGFVDVPTSPSIDSITDQVTISGWGYLEGTIMDYATIASREDAGTIDQHYHISIDQRTETPVVFIKTEAGNVRLTTGTPVVRQTWIHIAGTYDGTTARLFVDGQEMMSQGMGGRFVADTTPFILGGNANGAGNANVTERFPGRIDEIMLYRRALSAAEIAQLHDGALFR